MMKERRGGSVDATNSLGVLFKEHGNVDTALELYQQAHAAGVAPATHNLASMYVNGRGVAKDQT